jgi:Ca-activated chloride channel family protein
MLTRFVTLSPLFLALSLAALGGCKKEGIEIKPPDPVEVVAPAVDPEVVSLASALSQKLVAADKAGEIRVRLRIDAAKLKHSKRPPINVVLVVDSSGSMEGKAIEDARAAALALVDGLAEGDHFAVVTFDSLTRVLVPSTTIDAASQGSIREHIGKMAARGTTDLAGGLTAGLAEVQRGYLNNGVNRLVLLSDGVPNDESAMASLGQTAASMQVSITALGLGLEYNETLLASLARQTGGKFHFIEDSAKVAAVLGEEVLRLERIVAQNLTLSLLPGPGVSIEGVLGHNGQPLANRGLQLGLGDLGEGSHRELIVRLRVGPHRDGASLELMDAVLGFQDAVVGAGLLERRVFVAARASGDPAQVAASRDPQIELQFARALADAATVDAIALARGGQLAAANIVIDRAEPEARQAAKQFDDADLRAQAEGLVKLRKALPTLGPAPQPMTQPIAGGMQPAAVIAAPAAPVDSSATVKRSHARAVQRLQGE